ncbi:MAG TPA: NAD+ synthase [Ktedonobacterales bacterium]|jgi:NAD+ synthase (glutamine-hydrolysing)
MRHLRIALAQINSVVGDLEGNLRRILEGMAQAKAAGADLVAFPELALTGYPPEDLLLKPGFVADNLCALDELVRRSATEFPGITAVVGFVDRQADIYNAAAVIHNGHLAGVYYKQYLPNYGVFDENRYFQAGTISPIFEINDVQVGVNICEDIWYPTGPTTLQAHAGAELLVNINASPYFAGKNDFRAKMLATRAADNGLIVAYINLVGGQDELVFDGSSMIFDQGGTLIARAKQCAEDLLVADLDVEAVFRTRLHDPRRRQERLAFADGQVPHIQVTSSLNGHNGHTAPEHAAKSGRPARHPALDSLQQPDYAPRSPARIEPEPERLASIYNALVLGTRDYTHKNGFKQAVIGISGGIDSALTSAIAVDALGPENVIGVSMPARYSSEGSQSDARELAERLGIRLMTISIDDMFSAALEALAPAFAGTKPGLAEENLQARLRGMTWMALSNKFGWLVLTAGNKSEMATGYATLYGDMAGGFAVLKDVFKTLVYDLARYRNRLSPGGVIPQNTIDKPPSAELRPDQRDDESLPPYPVLDPILRAYVEEDRSYEEMLEMGFDGATIQRVMVLVDKSEYKRRQAPPGIKITQRAFGRDRRLPLTSAYRGRPSPWGGTRAAPEQKTGVSE